MFKKFFYESYTCPARAVSVVPRVFTGILSKFNYGLLLAIVMVCMMPFTIAFPQGLNNNNIRLQDKFQLVPDVFPRKIQEFQSDLIRNPDSIENNIILLYGKSGTGKSKCIEHVAHSIGYEFIPVWSSSLITKMQGSGARAVTEVMQKAEKLHETAGKRVVIFFDDIFVIAKYGTGQLSTDSSYPEAEATMTKLCQYLSRYQGDNRFIFCFATNKLSSLHSTFKDRFSADSIIEFKLPEAEERQRLLKHYLEKYNFSLEADLGLTKKDAEKALAQYVSDSKGLSHRAIALSVESLANSRLARSLSDQDLEKLLNLTAEDLKNLPVEDQKNWEKMNPKERLAVIKKNILRSNTPPAKLNKDQLSGILKANQGKGGSSWYAIDLRKALNTTATITTIISQGLNIYVILTGKGSPNPQTPPPSSSPNANS